MAEERVLAIVPPDKILDPEAVIGEFWSLPNLSRAIDGPLEVMEWLARRRLIANSRMCDQCQVPLALHNYMLSHDGKRWACVKCNTRKSVREGSLFFRSKLMMEQVLFFIYTWALEHSQVVMRREASVANCHTSVAWCTFLREECEWWLEEHPDVIGGMNENGEPVTVEINKSNFFHYKHHRGLWHEGHWVFVGVERATGKCFLVEVPDRRPETLEAVIMEHILPGSRIVSDGWASYANISSLGDGIYLHDVHRQNVDPGDDSIDIENMESLWLRMKKKIRYKFGVSNALFTTYAHEYLFRNRFRNQDMFGVILDVLAQHSPV